MKSAADLLHPLRAKATPVTTVHVEALKANYKSSEHAKISDALAALEINKFNELVSKIPSKAERMTTNSKKEKADSFNAREWWQKHMNELPNFKTIYMAVLCHACSKLVPTRKGVLHLGKLI